jgi:hypothetical protein
MAAESPDVSSPQVMKELRDIQVQFFDKSSNYTKLIFGLAYGGFFAFWAGTKQYLPPRQAVFSALLMTVSLVLFIAFEVLQTAILSYIAIAFSRSAAANDPIASLEHFRRDSYRLSKASARAWFAVFPVSVISGFAGVGILVWGWVRWLWAMKP